MASGTGGVLPLYCPMSIQAVSVAAGMHEAHRSTGGVRVLFMLSASPSTVHLLLMASGTGRRSVARMLSHVHPTVSVALMASGTGGVLSFCMLSHVHPTGSVAVMASCTGACGGALSLCM
ncbi:hypothetical protein AVEN_178472-1 [Araneus ventricosus]|uniref:Uncharacterized protein n=1 Tax=Araneus ventricosus TaxID=182803 RepID=A0A4Y2CF91_ARAVE|nr:hypothetical protein AVEN_178472-1 [Araneus ventricosus]